VPKVILKIALSTIGKFHSFDLARQMHKRGALTAIYSGYPWFKLRNEGLPRQSVRTFPYLHVPYMRLAPRFRPALWEWQDRVWFDRHVAHNLPFCDVFCGLSGSGLRSGRVAKSRGAKYVCDRGSSHIRVQDHILREEHDRQGIPFCGIDPRMIEHEEAEYEIADAITVPSTFVFNSFIEAGVPRQKIRLVPYGVDLTLFRPCAQPDSHSFSVLFVGHVSVRKGSSYLFDAFQQLKCRNKQLTLVGSISPEMEKLARQAGRDPQISFLGHVPQVRLKEIMSASHVMVLPSVEEGLALVQAQAMACGCPVIASENTGSSDLFSDGKEGYIVPIRDSRAIASRLQQLADDPKLRQDMSEACLQRVKSVGGWEQYGEAMYRVFGESIN
jgi:alpha-maltose-1-phosphate synthase